MKARRLRTTDGRAAGAAVVAARGMVRGTPSWPHEEITAAHHVTGRYDYLLARHFGDLQAVDLLLGELKRDGLVAESETRFALRSVEGVSPTD